MILAYKKVYVHCKKKNDPPLYLPSLIFIISTSWSASRPYTVTWRWHRIFHGGKSYVQRDEVVNAGCIQRSAMILRDNGEIVLFITCTPHSWLWSEHCRGSGQLPPVTTVPGELFCFDWGHCRLDSLGVLSCRLPVLNLSTQHLFTQSRAPPSEATRSLRGTFGNIWRRVWLSQMWGVECCWTQRELPGMLWISWDAQDSPPPQSVSGPWGLWHEAEKPSIQLLRGWGYRGRLTISEQGLKIA